MMHMGRKPSAKVGRVRTTVTLDPDVAKLLEQLQRDRGQGLSEVLNNLVRAGSAQRATVTPFVQGASDMGEPLLPIDCTGRLLQVLDEERFGGAR